MRLLNVDYLRGFAAFAVLFFHTTNTVENYPTISIIRNIGEFGRLGVDIFFIISGFIIPYSMKISEYRFGSDTGIFFAKRLARVEPTYLASIIFTVLMGCLVNWYYQKELYAYSIGQILSHLFYLTNFLGYEWINPVYWTLAIEFQFYITLALIYPLLFHSIWRNILFLLSAIATLTMNELFIGTLIEYIPFFAIGVIACLLKFEALIFKRALVFLGVFFLLILIKFGLTALLFSLLTFVSLISSVNIKQFRLLRFLGLISYSIYLFHYPIVEKLVRIGKIAGYSAWSQLIVLFISIALSILVAWVVFIFIERPSLKLAGSLKYISKKR